MLGSFGGASLPLKGLTSLVSFLSVGNNLRATASPKPVPMRPTYSSRPSRWTPASSERSPPRSVVQPPSTTSCPARHLALVHPPLRPDTYGASRRFETMPSRSILQAESHTSLPLASKCSTYRIVSPASASSSSAFNRALRVVSGSSRQSSLPSTSRSNAKNTRPSDRSSDNAACSAAKLGMLFLSSAQISPSSMQSGSASAALAIAANCSVQSRPVRVRIRALPFCTRSCTR